MANPSDSYHGSCHVAMTVAIVVAMTVVMPQRLSTSAASELILSKEQLYEMFQNILGVKKFEHQLLFNACQLDNADEQASQIRRELDGRLQQAETLARVTILFSVPFTY
ncbi:putative calcium-dependent secretion activator 1 [Apostichopus japonicus]|uniref:Putative calcium-dependent secretion activator 1 n=1 Tax=Stichopus japonicus TaxID=307972 RepID=A0A2G8JW31_STIJA|nr:putative calcium-dependent secretion activator 1 [Apostichopus japonicus]